VEASIGVRRVISIPAAIRIGCHHKIGLGSFAVNTHRVGAGHAGTIDAVYSLPGVVVLNVICISVGSAPAENRRRQHGDECYRLVNVHSLESLSFLVYIFVFRLRLF
jgi:hypothetical protein